MAEPLKQLNELLGSFIARAQGDNRAAAELVEVLTRNIAMVFATQGERQRRPQFVGALTAQLLVDIETSCAAVDRVRAAAAALAATTPEKFDA